MGPARGGLRPTLRHLMILVALAAIVSAVAAPVLRDEELRPHAALLTLLIPASTLLLAVLVLLFDRPGPSKWWLAGFVAHLFPPLLFACIFGLVLWNGTAARMPCGWPGFIAVMAGCIVSSARAIGARLPARCPACGRRTAVPIGRVTWCATCERKVPRPTEH